MNYPRIMLAAPASGSGKTMITCGILQALKQRGYSIAACKCGPDYIDPQFHQKTIGAKVSNLDAFFSSQQELETLFIETAKQVDLTVVEGVMGYYDGLGGVSTEASSYDVSKKLRIPTILIVDARGMSVTLLALLQGMVQFCKDHEIKGVILNKVSPGMYQALKEKIEENLPLRVCGYVPLYKDFHWESRYLGLQLPHEIQKVQEMIAELGSRIQETIDLDQIIALAKEASELKEREAKVPSLSKPVTIAVAKDEAFCFYYQENIALMEKMGAKIRYFSPLREEKLPEECSGILLGGGYPELYAKELSENRKMLASMKKAYQENMPIFAECGGFLYLHEQLKTPAGQTYPMVGLIPAKAEKQEKLTRFGYVTLRAKQDYFAGKQDLCIKGHEFHYYESSLCGDAFVAQKPVGTKNWDCIYIKNQLLAGFPHFYYPSNPQFIFSFLQRCLEKEEAKHNGIMGNAKEH